jgi:peptidoglycan/xylan/chitin deacetylase (PgdA/CDA1 family)
MHRRGRDRIRPIRPLLLVAALVAVGALCAACGGAHGHAATPPPTPPAFPAAPPPAVASPPSPSPARQPAPAVPTAVATHPSLSTDALQRDRPNEMGQVLILEYHQIGTPESQFVRSPQHLRDDLQWLYDHDFVTERLVDYLADDIHAPAGKRPVVLTFDDGSEGQFRYLVDANGQTRPDPDSAVPILLAFDRAHPGFGHHATFFLLPYGPFGRTTAQLAYARQKLDFMVAQGFELGNHTLDHTNLATVSDADATKELATAVAQLHHYLPGYDPHTVALPFGGYPPGGPAVLRHGTYEGTAYDNVGALLVGAAPAPSPAGRAFDPMRTPRVQAYGPVLAAWFATIEQHPDEFYVSDGDPNTITVPDAIPASIGTLDTARLAAEGRLVVRYRASPAP